LQCHPSADWTSPAAKFRAGGGRTWSEEVSGVPRGFTRVDLRGNSDRSRRWRAPTAGRRRSARGSPACRLPWRRCGVQGDRECCLGSRGGREVAGWYWLSRELDFTAAEAAMARGGRTPALLALGSQLRETRRPWGTQGKVTRPRGQLDRLHARGVSRRRRAAARGHAGPPRRRCGLPGRGVRLHDGRSHLRRGWVHSGVAQASVRRTPPRAPRGQPLGAGTLCARARRGRRQCPFLFHLRRFKNA
jgi:hypothetical protein